MKALYRKYRPTKLSEVVGQEQVTKVLENSLKSGKISHAYLFIGPRGTGKTSVARIFAHEVNSFDYQVEDDYVDIIEIDGASNRGIDNIRELREKVMVAPTAGKYKIYIIDEVHMLTKEAFNALLKTLEEPPAHVIFIMATTDAYKVPVTITSRAQVFAFKLAEPTVMQNYLKQVCEKEKIKITDDALALVVKRGGGSFRDTLSLLDQISTLSNDEITKDLVVSALGLPEDEKIAELLEAAASGNVVILTTLLKNLLSSGLKPETLAEELISAIIDNPKPEYLPLLAKLPEVKAPFPEAKLLTSLCNNIEIKEVKEIKPIHKIENNIKEIKTEISQPQPIKTETSQPTENKSFDWNAFLNKVQELSDAIYSQAAKTNYEFTGGTLHIYPDKKIARTILSRDNNKKILISAANGAKVVIHDLGETPQTQNHPQKDALISKISDIMGGEVYSDGGGNPF